MTTIESRIPRRRANSEEPRTNYFVRKLSKLVLNESNLQNTSHLKDFNMNHKLSTQQPKFTNPFARLDFRKKRKKTTKVKVPPLDFPQSYTELILELAYTSNLTRQVIRPFNRCHLISQLTECARLIRGRIASGAACIQLPLLADSKKDEQRMSDNRMIMVKINQFNEAHALFTDWINKLSSAPFVTNTFGPTVVQPSDENSPTNQQILLSKSNYSIQDANLLQDLQCDGELLFCQLQSCALAVFELLKNVGYTTFVEPSCMEASLYKSCYAQNESTPTHLNKNGHEIKNSGTEILSHSNSYNNTSIKSSSVFTDEDRELLAKLWRYLDPNSSLSGTSSPPPKPPLPNLCPLNIPFSDRRTDLVSSSNQSSQLSMNPFDDPNLLAYLCTIASTAQQKYPSNSSPIKKSSDCQKEFTLPTTRLDLNATDHLCFPLVDESDTSDLESNFNYLNNSIKLDNSCTIQTPSCKPNSALFSIKDASHSVIEQPKLPTRQKEKFDHFDETSLYSTTCNGKFSHVHSSRKLPFQLKECKYWSKSMSSADSNNPLSDSLMQEEVAKMVMHLQDNDSCTSHQLENPLITCTSSASNSIATSSSDTTVTTTSTTLTTVIPNEQNTSTLNSDANCESMTSITEDIDDRSPNCHSEVKSDTEDVYEFIEANGKKYRRHFQRRVVIERHKVREIILAPSLPDGMGPDLNRVTPQPI